jgi:hypothetical protein
MTWTDCSCGRTTTGAVKMAAFTRADSSDRRSFDAHHHRIRDNRTTRSLRAALVGMRREGDD